MIIVNTQIKGRKVEITSTSSQEYQDFAKELEDNLRSDIALEDGKSYKVKYISLYMGRYTIEIEDLEYSNSGEIFKDVFFVDNSIISRNDIIIVL